MTERAATTAGETITVTRVSKDVVYETELSVDAAELARGAKQTISTDGNYITATTEGGVAEVVSFDGTAAGDRVRVRF